MRTLALAVLWLGVAAGARAQEVVAVVSSGPGPYRAAYESFVQALGRRVPALKLGRAGETKARVIVAFGGEAASQTYPENATLIACMAPALGYASDHQGPYAFLTMKPAPAALISGLKLLQPGLKRLAVLAGARDTERYVADLRAAGQMAGVELVVPEAAGPEGVPGALREIAGKSDAIWLAPDPKLVNPESFAAIRQFSGDHSVPFYAPTSGLAAAGASAAVSVGPEDVGRQAAEMTRRALAGEPLEELVYPGKVIVTINVPAAAKSGLTPSAEALSKADKVIR